MLKEKDIAYENGNFWILAHKKGFHVMRSGATHSVCDSAYETLELAKVRCDYLARTVKQR